MARQQLYQPEVLATDISRIAGLMCDFWSIKIINSLIERKRFNQVQQSLKISSKTLSKRLKELEKQGIVTRTLYAQVPLRVEYELTEKGFELKALFEDILKWDKKWQ